MYDPGAKAQGHQADEDGRGDGGRLAARVENQVGQSSGHSQECAAGAGADDAGR